MMTKATSILPAVPIAIISNPSDMFSGSGDPAGGVKK